jgi:hypothetical protein
MKRSKYYHGQPCMHCGSTLRYRSNRACVACPAKQERDRIRLENYTVAERQYRARWQADYYRRTVLEGGDAVVQAYRQRDARYWLKRRERELAA